MKIRTQLSLNLLLLTGLLLLLGAVSKSSINALEASTERVAHTHTVIAQANHIQKLLLDMETGQRGFLLSGNELFLQPFHEGRIDYATGLQKLEKLVADNPEQLERLSETDRLVNRWLAQIVIPRIEIQRTLKRNPDTQATYRHHGLETGKQLMDLMRSILDEFIRTEKQLLNERQRHETQIAKRNNYVLGAGFLLYLLGSLISLQVTHQKIMRKIGGEPAEIEDITRRIAQGNLEISIGNGNTTGILRSVKGMVESLRGYQKEQANLDWQKTGLSRLSEILRDRESIHALVRACISELTTYSGGKIGAFYIFNTETKALQLFGSYAFNRRKNPSGSYHLGQGLIGQAALEQQQITLEQVPEDYIRVSSQLGECTPQSICITPLIHDGNIKGVIEVGSLTPVSEAQQAYLLKAADLLAMSIESMLSKESMKNALEESIDLTKTLQSRERALQAANEELEARTAALSNSEQKLKDQQGELESINSELGEQTEYLQHQRRDLLAMKQELEQKAEELERANRYKSQFLANMSHELRTPLNSLLILADSLASNSENNLTPDQVKAAEVIESSGNVLLSLIDEILDLSKIEAGHMELDIEPIETRELADSMRRNFEHVLKDRSLKFKVVLEKDMPEMIHSDEKRLSQILRNLLSNAGKFTEKGSVTLTFGSTQLNDKPAFFASVKDTGPGIPAEKQELIFNAFQQAESGTARKYGGTGLGLAICRELAHLLGGEIELQSSSGKGSVFRVRLPLELKEANVPNPKNDETAATPVLSNKIVNPNFGTISDDRETLDEKDSVILVVEDDSSFAKILREECHARNLKCLIATTGEEGLHLAKALRPSAVLLDVMLPGIDGHTVLDQLKENLQTRHIPVHAMSVNEPSMNLLNNGAVGFMKKPADPEDLKKAFQRIEDLLEHRIKNLLVVEQDDTLRKNMLKLIGNDDVNGEGVGSASAAVEALKTNQYDCVILDLKLPDMDGIELLKKIAGDEAIELPPIIVYSERELSRGEEATLARYSESIIIKGVCSNERLYDEAALFLHRRIEKMPEKKRKMVTDLHDTDRMLRDKCVLMVDDDMRNLFALSGLLNTKGMRVLKAQNGRKALEVLKDEPKIDLILMDIMMPVMDGYETIRSIRRQSRFAHTPIIALTAKAMKEDRSKCIEAGASDYLAKPVNVDRLLSMMRVWMYR